MKIDVTLTKQEVLGAIIGYLDGLGTVISEEAEIKVIGVKGENFTKIIVSDNSEEE